MGPVESEIFDAITGGMTQFSLNAVYIDVSPDIEVALLKEKDLHWALDPNRTLFGLRIQRKDNLTARFRVVFPEVQVEFPEET